MPPANTQLGNNVRVSASKLFMKDEDIKSILLGTTGARKLENGHVAYEVTLDEMPGKAFFLKQGCLKYLRPVTHVAYAEESMETVGEDTLIASNLESAVESSADDESDIDLTPGGGLTAGEVFVDSRFCSDGYRQTQSKLSMQGQQTASPLD